MRNKIKEQKGLAASDALIAVLIIVLFSGLIASISYNIYLSNSSVKRISKATGYMTNTCEYSDKEYYTNVTIDGLKGYFNDNQELFNLTDNQINITSNNTEEIATSVGNSSNPIYSIDIYIEYYNKTEGNTEKLDLVKEITTTVTYKLGNKNQVITMKTNKINN